MRHNRKINHLGRKSSHRHALMSNLAASLILHKRINTTLAKAKALRSYVEPIISRSKDDTTHSRRMVFRYLQNKSAVAELFREIAPRVAERAGGYTRIIKLENRPGDNAEVCMMELVDFNTLLGGKGKEAPAKKSKGTRRSGGAKKKATAEGEAPAAEEKKAPAKKAATRSRAKKSDDKKSEE